jgi:nitrogen fixation protein NifU and related proteins
MPDSRTLYEHLILEHNKHPQHYGALEAATASVDAYNPLCGDTFKLYIQLENNTFSAITFEGNGCAISKASASMLTEILRGRTVDGFHALYQAFHSMLQESPDAPVDEATLGNLTAFAGVRAYPMRIKCAMLPWRALDEFLKSNTAKSRE